MFRPVISVVVPCYNSEKYIVQTLRSVCDQTYEGMIETVVVDDCSTDGSVSVVREFIAAHGVSAQDHGRTGQIVKAGAETSQADADPDRSAARTFRLICKEQNEGVAQTRNRGVKESSGEYVCYLDADDLWDETKIEKQVALLARYMEQKNVQTINGDNGTLQAGNDTWAAQTGRTDSRELRTGGGTGAAQTGSGQPGFPDTAPVLLCTGRELVDSAGQSLGKCIPVPKVITWDAMLKTNLIPCSSVMVRRDVALQFPMERDDLVEDYINWMKIIHATGPAAGIDEPLMKYRVIQGSRSRNKLKAARKHFQAQRYLGESFPAACVNFISYVINGVRKI